MSKLVTVTKFEQLAEILRSQVRQGLLRPGQKLPGERALAREYGVAHFTVNKAVAGLVAAGLLERRQGDGTYVCEPSTPLMAAQTSAVMVDTRPAMHDPFLFALPPFLQAQELYPLLLHWQAVLDDAGPLERLFNGDLAAFIAHGRCGLPLATLPKRRLATRLIVLGCLDQAPVLPGSYILNDFDKGGRLATEHLLTLGCRRFLVLGPPGARSVAAVSGDGFLSAACQTIAGAGRTCRVVGAADLTAQDFAGVFGTTDYPDGIISTNDFRLVTALEGVRMAGRSVPEEVRGVGQYNTPWAVTAGLTSVELDMAAMLDQVKEVLAGGEDRSICIAPRLVIRRSSVATEAVDPRTEA